MKDTPSRTAWDEDDEERSTPGKLSSWDRETPSIDGGRQDDFSRSVISSASLHYLLEFLPYSPPTFDTAPYCKVTILDGENLLLTDLGSSAILPGQ